MQSKDVVCIFWLYGWNNTDRFLSAEDLIRCDVTAENIHIESQQPKDIQIRMIQKCDVYTVGGRGFWRSMIRLKVSDGNVSKDVFIFPANPCAPANERTNGSEVNAFSESINSLIAKMDVVINPNPYHRNTIPKQWAVKELDASISPWVYFHRYRKKTSLTRAVAQLIATIAVLVVLVVLLALFAEYLTH